MEEVSTVFGGVFSGDFEDGLDDFKYRAGAFFNGGDPQEHSNGLSDPPLSSNHFALVVLRYL